jgi:hypothetical protein
VLDWDRLDPGRPAGSPICRAVATGRSPTSRGVVHVLVNGVPIRRDEQRVGDVSSLPGGLLGAVPASGAPQRP